MSPELDTLNVLSDRFEALADALPRSSTGGMLLLDRHSSLPGEGEQLLEVYEALYAHSPGDAAIRSSLARHLFRLGDLYARSVDTGQLAQAAHSTASAEMAARAQNACRHLARSYQLLPGAYAALALADLFRSVGFYGTALAWYAAAEEAQGDAQTIQEAGRQRQALRKQGRAADPPLAPDRLFPTYATPGLAPPAQAGMAAGGGADRSGQTGETRRHAIYGAAALVALLACLGAFGWLHSRSATQPPLPSAASAASAGASAARNANSGATATGSGGSRLSSAAVPLRDTGAWTLRASSTRSPVSDRADAHTITYAPRNAVDADATTAWSPGKNLANDDIGEWLEVDFPAPRTISRVGLIAGYPKQHPFYGDVFWLNNRVHEALLTFSDGTSVSWTLKDEKPMQFLTLPAPVQTTSARIPIQSVYKSAPHRGSGRRWHDTSLAEIAFWGAC